MSRESLGASFLHYQAPALFDRAKECSRNRQGVATVMLAVASIEAMPHDLVGAYWLGACYVVPKLKEKYGGLAPVGAALPTEYHPCKKELLLFTTLKEKEEERASLLDKIETIYFMLHETKAPKGDATWQDFFILKKVRDSVTHPQTQIFSQGGYSEESKIEVKGGPRILEELARKKLISLPSEVVYGVNWLDLLDTEEFLDWCIKTTKKYYQFVLDFLPSESNLTASFQKNMRLN